MMNNILIETIKIQTNRVRNILYHNARCNATRKALFGDLPDLDLRDYIDTNKANYPICKCRITYAENVISVDYEPYKIRPIKSLKMIEVGNFNYAHKYKNRDGLATFYNQREDCDDILMLQNGYLLDSYYTNVALLKNREWFTPLSPLLKGTMRAQLLHKNKIQEAKIHSSEINTYESISLFNAMIPFGDLIIDCQDIKPI